MGVYFMDYDFNSTIDNIRKLMTQTIERFEEEVTEALLENERFYAFRGEDALRDLGVRVRGMDSYLEGKYFDLVQVPTKQKLHRALEGLLEKLEEAYVAMEKFGNEKQIEKFENSLVQLHQAFTTCKIIRNNFNSDEFEELQSTVGNFYLNSMPFDPMEHGYHELTSTCRQAQNRFEDRMDELNRSLQRHIDQQLNIEITVFLAEKEEMAKKQEQEANITDSKQAKVEEEIKQDVNIPTEQSEKTDEQDAELKETADTSDIPETEKLEETRVEISIPTEQSEKIDEQDTQIEEQVKTDDLPETQTVEDQKTNDDDIRAQQLLEQEEKIRELEKLVAEQEARIAEKNQKIVELEENRRELSATIDHAEQQITALNQRVDELTAREQEKDQEMQRLKEDNELLTRHNEEKSEMITTLQSQIKEMGQAQKGQSQPKELTPEEDLEQTYQLLHSFSDEQKQAFYKSSKSQEALEDLLLLKMKESVQPSHQELLDELILTLLDGRSSVTVEEDKMGIGHK